MLSFIIPAKDEERYISGCIGSIYSQDLGEEFEVVVVDNNCIDRTVGVVREKFPQVRVVSEKNPGTNPARQRGFVESKGEIVIFMDADVRLPNHCVHRAIQLLRKDPRVAGISGPYRFYDFDWWWNLGNELFMHLFTYPFSWISPYIGAVQMQGGFMVIRRQVLLKIGGFDTSRVFYGDDTGTAMRLKQCGRVIFSPRFWVYSSARRYNKKGVFPTLAIYLLNLFSNWLFHRPYNADAEIVR